MYLMFLILCVIKIKYIFITTLKEMSVKLTYNIAHGRINCLVVSQRNITIVYITCKISDLIILFINSLESKRVEVLIMRKQRS